MPFFQAFMDSYFSHLVGHHSKKIQMNRQKIQNRFDKLSAISIMLHWVLCYYRDFVAKRAPILCHSCMSPKCIHSSMFNSHLLCQNFSSQNFNWVQVGVVFRMRSFLCGLTLASSYILASIATKTYYNLEMWLSLPGAILVYGLNSVIGYKNHIFL